MVYNYAYIRNRREEFALLQLESYHLDSRPHLLAEVEDMISVILMLSDIKERLKNTKVSTIITS